MDVNKWMDVLHSFPHLLTGEVPIYSYVAALMSRWGRLIMDVNKWMDVLHSFPHLPVTPNGDAISGTNNRQSSICLELPL